MLDKMGVLPEPNEAELAEFRRATAELYALKEMAFAAGDPEPIVSCFYAEDATTVGPNGKIVQDRAAFRAMYTEMVRDKTVAIVPWRSFVQGDTGWDWTRFHVRPNDPAKTPSTFIILFIWTRDKGRWLCAGDMFLPEAAPTRQS